MLWHGDAERDGGAIPACDLIAVIVGRRDRAKGSAIFQEADTSLPARGDPVRSAIAIEHGAADIG